MSRPRVEIAYLTDVEGDLDYFDRWVQQSRILRYRPNKPDHLELVHDQAYFVYGGDAVDRGEGNRRILERLVRLKKDYPSRVHLLAGNRDLNKLRFTSELSDSDMARPFTSIPRPHWSPSSPSLAEYLTGLAEASPTTSAKELDTRAMRLRYYYLHTLGCPHTFEFQRRELAEMGGRELESVSDDEVVDAVLADSMPGGAMRQYLECAELAVVLGNTLFVHGAIDEVTMGVVPDDGTRFELPEKPPPVRQVSNVREWAAEMNAFLQRGLQDHLNALEWDAARQRRGGEQLLAVQNRQAMWGRSIVSNCYCDGGTITSSGAAQRRSKLLREGVTNPHAFADVCSEPRDKRVAQWLLEGGVHRCLVGHKPSGDSPALLSSTYTGVEIISADSNYADPKAPDGRGQAVACVLLCGSSIDENHAVVYGVLADGQPHEVKLPTLGGLSYGGDPYVGKELEDGWWVKARLLKRDANGFARYRCCRGDGRKVESKEVSEDELARSSISAEA